MNTGFKQKEEQILRILPESLKRLIKESGIPFEKLEEIRLRIGSPFLCVLSTGEVILPDKEHAHIITKQELTEALEYISQYSFYAFEQEVKQGFLTIEGGHRIGLSGKTVLEHGKVKTMTYISSMNIRVAHEVKGCAEGLIPYLVKHKRLCHSLIIAPPRCGKTTVLRDLIRIVSNGAKDVKGATVGVVDERSEIGGCYMGVAQNELGIRTDIMDCCPKEEGMLMLIRSMAPEVLAVDEIGTKDEVRAVEYAMHCGCKLLASIHGESFEEIKRRPYIAEMIAQKRFERYIVLENREHAGSVREILDETGRNLMEKEAECILK